MNKLSNTDLYKYIIIEGITNPITTTSALREILHDNIKDNIKDKIKKIHKITKTGKIKKESSKT